MRFDFGLKIALFVAIVFVAAGSERVTAEDWPCWRGERRDGICREEGLLQRWPDGGPTLLWKSTGLGVGFSGPAVVDGTLYIMGNVDGKECVMAIDTADGKRLWTVPIGPVEYDGYQPGMRGTPTVDGDRLYALGASGELACLNRHNGDRVWRCSFVADFGGQVLKWGYSESVLIDGKKLVCTPGGPDATFVAMDKMNGRVIWRCAAPVRANYASMVATEFDGVRQYVQFTGDALVGVGAGDGRLLWRYDAPAYTKYGGINISTPICSGRFALAASGYGIGGGLVRIARDGDRFAADEVYFTKDMKNHHGGMILKEGKLYGCNDPSILTCMEFETGRVLWKTRDAGKCSILSADGMLYCRDENGPITLVKASADRFEQTGRFDPPDRSDQKAWPQLVVAAGRMYVRDQDVLLCYDVRAVGQ